MGSAARARRNLVEHLRREEVLDDPQWTDAFRRVPRHVFLPRFFVPHGGRWKAVARGDDGWLAAVYSDNVLVTQLDDCPENWAKARHDGPITGTPTCSSSMPAIMAVMLQELRVRDDQRVLEIGTGTGYNAALLCHRLGAARVSTVDIDPELIASARAALNSLDYAPVCEATDGEQGFPPGAPYDRVLCTCSVSTIPPAWLAQTRPGGLVVTTLNRPIGAGLVRVVAREGATGEGRVLARDGRFMPLRAHRFPKATGAPTHPDSGATQRETDLSLQTVLDPASRFEFFAGLALPGVTAVNQPDGDRCYLVHPDGSWAGHQAVDEHGYVVEQGGPRRLWDLAEAAFEEWHELGRPGRDEFGVSVSPERQEIWLHDPESEHRWPLSVPTST